MKEDKESEISELKAFWDSIMSMKDTEIAEMNKKNNDVRELVTSLKLKNAALRGRCDSLSELAEDIP